MDTTQVHNNSYKRRYHPMVLLLFHSKMLSAEQLAQIPRTTQYNWSRFQHKDHFGYEMAEQYIQDFDNIKEVLISKHLLLGMKFMCSLSRGYKKLIAEIENNKKLLRQHANGIGDIARKGRMKKSDACRLFGVTKDWFYRHRKKVQCSASKIRKCFRQYPNQLTIDEVAAIAKIVNGQADFGKTKTTLYYQAVRNGIIACGKSTFFKYADLCGYKMRCKKKPPSRKEGFRASNVFEWLHVDVTLVPKHWRER
jgi:hypothetical protein